MLSILVIAESAVLTGARSFTAIGERAADAPRQVLAVSGARFDRRRGCYLAPEGVHLPAAMTHDGVVPAQRDVGAKNNEISEF